MKYACTALYVEDVPTVLEFYKKAFGFETKFYDEQYEYGELDAGGAMLAFGSHKTGELMMPGAYKKSKEGHPDGVEIAFYTEDVDEDYQKAIEAGATPIAEPKDMPWGQRVAYVRSIEGTFIGLCTEMEEKSGPT